MLGLKLSTDPRWANIAESNLEEILTDHAWCEHKAAANAMYIIMNNSENEELVTEMTLIAIEEMEHFKMVHHFIKQRGFEFGREQKDDYVNQLVKFAKKDGSRNDALVERLLFAAIIEARSCERFKVLSENINDTELATFYKELMISEANHYTTFLGFARKFSKKTNVDLRWKEWLDFEALVVAKLGVKQAIHG